jgi:anti-anti-sigma factor
MNPGKGSAVDTHPTASTSHNERTDGQALIHRPPMLRETAQRTGEGAVSARGGFDPPPTEHTAPSDAARLIPAAKDDRYVLVEVAGAIDILTRHQLADVLTRAVATGPPAVIVDLSAVTLLSAAGLHCLQQATDRLAEQGGSLQLVCPPDSPPDRILRLIGPYRGQPRHTDVAAAIHSSLGP